jgi:GGDEF domain-containing protein
MPPHSAPRPLADTPVVALGEQATEVAQAWLVELVASTPLDHVHELDTGAIARLGPALCADVLATLSSDAALTALPDAVTPLIAATGGGGAAAVVNAVEALRRAVWATATAAIPPADTAVLAALGDRLAHACSLLTRSALVAADAAGARTTERLWPPRTPGGERPEDEPADDVPPDIADEVVALEQDAPPEPEPEAGADPDAADGGPSEPNLRLADPPGAVRAAALHGSRGQPLWREALERRLASGGRCALLLVEVDGAERLEAAGEGAAMEAASREARAHVRRGDLIAQEPGGRLWVVAGDAGRGAARVLARRLAKAIELSSRLHGAALNASVGLALFPDDGHDAETLVEIAEEAMFAARADGVPMGDEDAAG